MPRTERKALSAALNTLLASPSFASWRQDASLDVGEWMTHKADKTPLVILSVAHLDDDERALVLGVVLEEVRRRAAQPEGRRVPRCARSTRACVE